MLPGKNKLTLTKEAIIMALEEQINAQLMTEADKKVRIIDIYCPYSSEFQITFTTDKETKECNIE